jgi:hypothetical protein
MDIALLNGGGGTILALIFFDINYRIISYVTAPAGGFGMKTGALGMFYLVVLGVSFVSSSLEFPSSALAYGS